MPLKAIKTSYNAGELSGYMDGREDINKYHNGCSKLINAIVLPHGGVTKRPGTQYIATAANKCKLFPFEFSVDDALILEFSNLLLRFYKDGAAVTIGAGTEDISGLGNVVAHWKLNDNAATTAVVDADGATHDGVATANTEDITTTGIVSTCFDFDSQYTVEIDDNADFDFGNGSTDSALSIAGWVFISGFEGNAAIISKWDTGAKRQWRLNIQENGKLRLRLADQSENKYPYRDTDDALSVGWHFIVATYDGTGGDSAAGGIILYVDGALVGSTATNVTGYVAMENNLTAKVAIGADYTIGALDHYWPDKIDNVAIFSDVLTPTEIASLYSTLAYSIVSPYTSAEAFEIHVTQSADVMYIAHEDHHPQKLSRLADTSWIIEDVPFLCGPFLVENTTSAYLVGFARTGGTARSGYYFPTGATGTLTATGAHSPFNSNMVGALWLVKHTRPDNTTSTFDSDNNATPTTLTNAIRIKGDYIITVEPIGTSKKALLWRKEGDGEWQEFRSFRGATSFSATEDEKDVYYAMSRSDNTIFGTLTAKNQVNRGVVKITAFTSSTVVTVEVIDAVLSDNSTDNAVTTSMWAEGAWSDYRGFPRTVTFFEDRLWWASSTNNPDTLWSSQSSLYENMEFSDLGLDSDAITAPLKDNEISQIQWMFARQVMAVGAANKEYRFGASDPDKPVTPGDRKTTPQTSFGSDDIQPIILNNAIFFFQRQGKKLGAMKFDAITENFDIEDATLLAYKLFDSAPTCMVVQRVPDSIIWVSRADGVLPTFTYEPDEEVSGWARQITDNSVEVETPVGFFESVAVIHGSVEDEVWASVRRVISGSTVYHIERFKPRDWGSDIEDAFFVDSGITYDSTAISTVIAAHLKGKTLAVFADGQVFDNAVADASTGAIILQKNGTTTTASTVQYGLPYTMKVRTMRLSIPQEGNTLQTRIKRIHSVVVRFIRSLLGSAGQEYNGIEYLQDLGAAYSTSSQDTPEDARLAEGGFSEDAYTTIVSDNPVPFTVLSTVISFEVEERR